MIGLAKVLKEAGQEPVCLGNKVVILPFGARILGLYPKADLNVFYIEKQLESAQTARAHLASTAWLLLGGDRTWIAPEVETIGDFGRSPETYAVPKGMDPGSYRVTAASETEVALVCDMDIHFKLTSAPASLRVTRKVSLLKAPTLPAGVSCAAYALDVALDVLSPLPKGVKPGLWGIVQFPKGGRMTVPIRPNAKPRTFFGEPVISLENNHVLCDVPTAKHFKFAVRAEDCCGIHAYINLTTSPATLVVQTFDVGDGARYVDVPSDDYSDTGYAQEIYVDDGGLGGFGELEHHSPALGFDDSREITDHSETFAFAGPEKALRNILEEMIASQLKKLGQHISGRTTSG